jgi:hypothetical protein
MAGQSGQGKVTTDHDVIRSWVEKRGGHPAQVRRTARGDSALLRIDYPGFSGEKELEPIEWDDFFKKFDKNKLAFLYQEKTKSDRVSRFSKLISRDTASKKAPPKRAAARRAKTPQRKAGRA